MPPGRYAPAYVPLTPEEEAALAAEQQAQQPAPINYDTYDSLGSVSTMGLPVETTEGQYEPAPVAAADPYAQDYANAQMPATYQPAPPPPDPAPSTNQASATYEAVNQGSGVPYEDPRSLDRSAMQNERRIYAFQQEQQQQPTVPAYQPLAPQPVGDTGAITLPAPPNAGVNNPLEAFVQGANAQEAPYSGLDREAFYRVRDATRAAEAVSPDRRERYEPIAPMSAAQGAALNPTLMRPTTGDYTPYQPIAPTDPYVQPMRDNPPGPLRNEPGAERPVWEVFGEGMQDAWQGSEGARNALGSLTGVYRPNPPADAPVASPGRERPVWEALGEGLGGVWQGTEGARNALGTATGVYRGDVGRPTLDVLAGLGSLAQRGSSNAGMDKSVPPGGALPDVGTLPSPPAPSTQGEVAHGDFPPGESYQPGQGDLRSQIDKAWNKYQPVPPGQSPGPGPNLPFDANSRPTLDFLNVFQRGEGRGAPTPGSLPATTVAQPSATDTPARSGQMQVLDTIPEGMQRATDAAGIVYVGNPGADPVGIVDPETNEVVLYPTEEQIGAILAKYDAISQQATGAQTTSPATTTAAPVPVYEPVAPSGGGSSSGGSYNGGGNGGGYSGGSSNHSRSYGNDYNDVGNYSDLKLEDFLQDYNNNGDIDAQDRKRAKREFSAALAKRKGTSRSRTRVKKSAGFNPLDRPESPIRTAILDELEANLPGGVPARQKQRR